MRQVGLYFGSFNPVHIGHLAIANHILQHSHLDEIVFVLSPQNPFKKQSNLLDEYQRLHLLNLAIEDNPGFSASDVEFKMPKPSYTGATLAYLEEQHPNKNFSLIMGEDNLKGLHKWKNVEYWIKGLDVFVYPRLGSEVMAVSPNIESIIHLHKMEAPVFEISASYIRKSIQKGILPRYIVPQKALDYIDEMGFYK